MKHKFRLIFVVIFIFCLLFTKASAQTRNLIDLPDIPGYFVLKGDFHMHTPFSDGSVWPTDRVLEAWRDGLDVIAITDHVEYSPNADVSENLNRPYEIARTIADEYGILIIPAAEITRQMPPGHFNAYFLSDANALKKTDYMESFAEAAKQGAFFIWNHPGWKAQQPDTTIWFPKHTELYNTGWLNGIEVLNEKEFYPIALKWAGEKNISIFANSDVHGPIDFLYQKEKGEKRPFTLVFASERSVEGVRQAFIHHRTAACFKDTMAGPEKLLLPLISGCIKVETPQVNISEKGNATVLLSNTSSFPIELESEAAGAFKITDKVSLPAHGSAVITITNAKGLQTGIQNIVLPFKVLNVLTGHDSVLQIQIKIKAFAWGQIQFKPDSRQSLLITCSKSANDLIIRYTLDGKIPDLKSPTIDEGFQVQPLIDLKMQCFSGDIAIGSVLSRKISFHKAFQAQIKLSEQPAAKYSAQGATSLTDGLHGTSDYKDGNWLGFQQKDLEAVLELESNQQVNNVQITFLEVLNSWIFAPSSVEIFTSTDGIDYTKATHITLKPPAEGKSRGIVAAGKQKNYGKIRFIKILAKNAGIIPEWHSASGKKAWLFVDEIRVD